MNSSATDHEPLVIDHTDRYRRMLIASQVPRAHYSPVEPPASLWECIGLALFAAAMLAGLAEAILWGLR